MPMKHCPICGEEYSDTYQECPFCEEERCMQEGGRRNGRRTKKRSRQFSLITPTLIILILIMAGLLTYLLYGDKLADRFGGQEGDQPPVENVLPPVNSDEEDTTPTDEDDKDSEKDPDQEEDPDAQGETPVVMPEGPADPTVEKPKPKPPVPAANDGYEKAAALPEGLTLSSTDFTVKVAGETNVLRASGGSGTYKWYSENPNVATVDASGKVTALSKGTVKIIATDGSKKGECIVRVNVSNTTPVTPPSQVETSTNAKLSKEDYTTHVGEPDVKLKVSGTTDKVVWTSGDSSIATVSADGVVKAVGKGTTTIKATVGGATLTCIVRVN